MPKMQKGFPKEAFFDVPKPRE